MNQLEPTNVAIALASVLFGPALAALVGPYAVILIASTVGAAWALGRRDPSARLGAAGYFLRLNVTALLVTVGLATLAGRWLGFDETNWMLAPSRCWWAAWATTGPGGRWLFERAARVLERKAGGGEGGA